MKLIGTGEIQRQHGVTRTQVFKLLKAGDWPKPYAELEDGRKVWEPRVITAHVKRLRKSGRLTEDNRIVPKRYLATA